MIDNTTLVKILNSRLACQPALKWLGKRNSDEMWTQCERPNWLLWWAAPYVPRTELVLILCRCARLSLPYVAAGELRPLRTIETAEAWTRGEATLEEVRSAARAAYSAAHAAEATSAASAAYSAAHAAAYVAFAADDANADRAAEATSAAAEEAARAAYAAVHAAGFAAQSRMCELIRQKWPKCPEPGVKG